MTDREKLRQVMATLLATAADIQKYLGTAPTEPAPVDPKPVDPKPADPVPVDPKPTDPALPLTPPTYSAPANIDVPAGQNVVWIPVTLEHTRLEQVVVSVNRAINQSPATINVGTNQAAFIGKLVYTWTKGDDRTHYVRLQFPSASYRDGQSVRLMLKGIYTRNEWVYVNVTFRDGATFPDMPPQRHAVAPHDPSTVQAPSVPTPPASTSVMIPPANIERKGATWATGNLVLPNWSGQGAQWAPELVEFRSDGSAMLSTRFVDNQFRSGLMQIFRPTFSLGLTEATFKVLDPNGVAAFFTYSEKLADGTSDGTEPDFELVRRPDGSLAWQLNIHMFVGGVRHNPKNTIFVPMSVTELAKDHRYGIDYQDGYVIFYIDGKVVGHYTQADVPNAPWQKRAQFDTFIGTYRHTGWAGWNNADYAATTTKMHVMEWAVPGLKPRQ